MTDCPSLFQTFEGDLIQCQAGEHKSGWHSARIEEVGLITWTADKEYKGEGAGTWGNAPAHYRGGGGLQPWDIIREFGLCFWSGNVLKYILRADKKGSRLSDLRKARHYLDYLIEQEEANDAP